MHGNSLLRKCLIVSRVVRPGLIRAEPLAVLLIFLTRLRRLQRPSDPRPDDGFLIAGVFTQVGADNRLRRAVIGSGQGAETLQLYVAARDLGHFTPPLYQTDDAAEASGTKPGAAIEINQTAYAVKFSMWTVVTDKDIKQAAQRISAELVKRINAAVKAEDEQLNRYAKP